jgi:outer membrane protein assembly factor BamB
MMQYLRLAVAGLLCWQVALGDDWAHWRGATRNGHSTESSHWQGDPDQWLPAEPAWTIRTGEGGSSPIISGDYLYSLGWENDQEVVTCFDTKTGQQQWQQQYAAPRFARHSLGDQGLYSGPSSTPEFDPDSGLLYTLGTDGDLRCWNANDSGALLWKLNLYDEYQTPQRPKIGRSGHRDYGFTSSPLVYQDVVIVEVGGNAGTLVAFDKRTGQQRWASAAKQIPGHTGGPALMTVEGVDCVAVLTCSHLLVTRMDEGHVGETVAEYEWVTDFTNNIAAACVAGNRVLITSAYDHNAMCCLTITLQGATKSWEQPYPSKVCTPVVDGQHVYVAWQRIRCLDLATGNLVWEGETFGDAGSLILTADDRLIAWVGQGELILAETCQRSPDKLTVLAKSRPMFRDDVWPHVALAQGRVYCKARDGQLHCFVLSQQ